MRLNLQILILSILSITLHAQVIEINEPVAFAKCPGVTYFFTATNSITNSCIFDWTVTNGSIQGGFQNGNVSTFSGGNSVNISWFDVTQNGQIKVKARDCSPSSGNSSTFTFTYAILSIKGVNPGAISGSDQVEVNVTANQTYSVPQINFPNVGAGDANPYQINGYEWEIPAGWTVISGGNTKTITVKPDNCSGGNLRVRGKNTQCYPLTFYSNWSTVKTISRTLSTPGAISGPDAVICSNTSVKSYSISAVAGATSYTWSIPSGWSGTSTTTSINVTPNGLNGGVISVKANGCSIQSQASSKPIAMNLTDPENPPLISVESPVCYAGRTFTLSNLPPNSTVSWSHSSNLTLISGQGTTSYSVRANSMTTSGSGWVDALITTPCGSPPAYRRNVWVGKPYNFLVEGPTLVTAGSFNDYNAKIWNNQPSFSAQGVASSGFSWSFPWSQTNAGWDCYGCTGEYIIIKAGSLSTYVTAQVENLCGTNIRNYEVFVQQDDCPPGGCEEPFIVYPNPSSDELTISSNSMDDNEITEISIADSNGAVIYSTTVKGSEQVKIPVRGFKNGIYYLSVTDKERTRKQQIVVNH